MGLVQDSSYSGLFFGNSAGESMGIRRRTSLDVFWYVFEGEQVQGLGRIARKRVEVGILFDASCEPWGREDLKGEGGNSRLIRR